MGMIRGYKSSPADAFVQEDVVFIMHREPERWKEWWTEPMPNIGLMLCKGNEQNVKMFEHAWRLYLSIEKERIRRLPGKDQNKVVAAMKFARNSRGFRWQFFPNSSAILIDKVWKFVNLSIELGGEVSADILSNLHPPTVAVHTTCYEQRTKVMGLKALSAFWTPHYYDIQKKTLTKQLVYLSQDQVNHGCCHEVFFKVRCR